MLRVLPVSSVAWVRLGQFALVHSYVSDDPLGDLGSVAGSGWASFVRMSPHTRERLYFLPDGGVLPPPPPPLGVGAKGKRNTCVPEAFQDSSSLSAQIGAPTSLPCPCESNVSTRVGGVLEYAHFGALK